MQKKSGGSKFFCEGRQTILQGTRQRMKISIRSWILQNVVFIQLLLYIKLYVWFYLKDIYWFLICKLLLQWAFTPLWCWWLNIFCYFIFRKIQLFIVCLLTVHKQDFAQKNFNAKYKNKRKMKKSRSVQGFFILTVIVQRKMWLQSTFHICVQNFHLLNMNVLHFSVWFGYHFLINS